MSLLQAFRCIQPALPKQLLSCISLEKEIQPGQTEYATAHFRIWKVKEPDRLQYIVEARLKMSDGYPIHTWLQNQYDFLMQIADDDQDALWQAYFIHHNTRTSLLINVRKQEYITYTTNL